MDKIIWTLKQILPLKYDSIFEMENKTYHCDWKMWFGKCFNMKYYEVSHELTHEELYGCKYE